MESPWYGIWLIPTWKALLPVLPWWVPGEFVLLPGNTSDTQCPGTLSQENMLCSSANVWNWKQFTSVTFQINAAVSLCSYHSRQTWSSEKSKHILYFTVVLVPIKSPGKLIFCRMVQKQPISVLRCQFQFLKHRMAEVVWHDCEIVWFLSYAKYEMITTLTNNE